MAPLRGKPFACGTLSTTGIVETDGLTSPHAPPHM